MIDRMITSILKKVFVFFAVLGLVLAAYWWVARPYQLHWGAAEEELLRLMPGDEFEPAATFLATRAITINGTPEETWPWLLQMGYERAGFYGYDIIENIGSPQGLYSAERIVPEFQSFTAGDEGPISMVARMKFHAIQPYRYLIWTGKNNEAGFTWALYPVDAQHTRLVSRIRWHHHWSPFSMLALVLLTEFTDHLAVRKILQGVKGRVEGQMEPMAQQNFEVGVFIAAFLVFCAALVILLVRPLRWVSVLFALAAGLGWLVVWYALVSAWFGALLQGSLLVGMLQCKR